MPADHPFTDIFCLVYNNRKVTEGFVKRLFQNTANFRLTFLDNGSTDDVKAFLAEGAEEGRWKLLREEANLGIIKGRNKLMRGIEADYFVNIDNDQYVGPLWLEEQFKLMQKGYDITGVEAWCMMPPTSQGTTVINGVQCSSRAYLPFRRCQRPGEKFTYIGCGGTLIKRAVVDKIGLFDDRFSPAYFEDPDFVFRAIRAGFKPGWCRTSMIDHLAHQTIGSSHLFFDKNAQFLKSWNAFISKWKPYFPEPLQME